jgi:hypothetical protein
MSTRHHPYDDEMLNEWNLHSLYGHMEAKATQEALRAARGADKRQFVLTRSSFAGTGRCAPGSVALSLCTTAHPLHTRVTIVSGASE